MGLPSFFPPSSHGRELLCGVKGLAAQPSPFLAKTSRLRSRPSLHLRRARALLSINSYSAPSPVVLPSAIGFRTPKPTCQHASRRQRPCLKRKDFILLCIMVALRFLFGRMIWTCDLGKLPRSVHLLFSKWLCSCPFGTSCPFLVYESQPSGPMERPQSATA